MIFKFIKSIFWNEQRWITKKIASPHFMLKCDIIRTVIFEVVIREKEKPCKDTSDYMVEKINRWYEYIKVTRPEWVRIADDAYGDWGSKKSAKYERKVYDTDHTILAEIIEYYEHFSV